MIFARAGMSLKDNAEITDKDLEMLFEFLDSYDEHDLDTLNYQNSGLMISIQQEVPSRQIFSQNNNQDIYRGPKPMLGQQPESYGDGFSTHQNTGSLEQKNSGIVSKTEQSKLSVSSSLLSIHASMSGSFYPSKEQGATPFVKVGEKVDVGQPVCVLEAMKLFTEVKSEVSGTIIKIHFKEGDLVTEGDVLFDVQP